MEVRDGASGVLVNPMPIWIKIFSFEKLQVVSCL